MSPRISAAIGAARPARIGVAKLTKMAFDGTDFVPLWNRLVEDVQRDPTDTPALLDLSVIAQFMSDPQTGASLQSNALIQDVLYRSPCATETPRLRVLAFAAPLDVGGNTPIEFLLEGSDVELLTLYVAPGLVVPELLPDHDVAIVTIPDSVETAPMLAAVEALARQWPRPVLNLPEAIKGLDRDALYTTLQDVAGLEIPMTGRISREDFADLALSDVILRDVIADGAFPLIARPTGSHGGKGLERIGTADDIEAYLSAHPAQNFFISRYVDYRDADGLYRKYRIVFVEGRAYACHMAISDLWKIWYLNADMAESSQKRDEEARFMKGFDEGFGQRHATVLSEIARRIGLDYFAIDCAETPDGKLLLFEADNASIVHNMDPPDVFPYKAPQMHKIFDAFVAMLYKYAGAEKARAA